MPSRMRQKSDFPEVLQAVRELSFGSDGALVLRPDDGRSMVSRRRQAGASASQRESPSHLLRP